MRTALFVSLLFLTLASQAEEKSFATPKQEMSYSLGVIFGKAQKRKYDYLESQFFLDGVHAGLIGDNSTKTQDEAKAFIVQYLKGLKQQGFSAATREDGIRYLAQNAKKQGVIVTDSGLQYEILRAGDGPKPDRNDTVKVHYRGTLVNGFEFDSSFRRHAAAEFKVRQVIDGWTEGLKLMSIGSKFRFVVPSDLAYGERRSGPDIGPGSTLVFVVELLSIN